MPDGHSPVKQGLIPVLEGLQHFPLPDVVRLDPALDDLVIRLLGNVSWSHYIHSIIFTFSALAAQPSLYSAMITSACSTWFKLETTFIILSI